VTNLSRCNCRVSLKYWGPAILPQNEHNYSTTGVVASVAKLTLHHQAVGSIGLHRYGAHVLRKGQTTFFEQASKLFPRVPTALDPRRHALFTGQIRGGESKSPLFNLFYSVQVDGPQTGLSLRSRGSCSHEASPFGCGTLLFILPEGAFAGPTAPQRLGMAEPPSSATLTIQADKY
jgi:hypothetical protein